MKQFVRGGLVMLTLLVVATYTFAQCADVKLSGAEQFWKDVYETPGLKKSQHKKINKVKADFEEKQEVKISENLKSDIRSILKGSQLRYFENFIRPKEYLESREIEWNGKGRSENKGGC